MVDNNIITALGAWGFSSLSIIALFFLAILFSSYVKIVTVLSMLRVGLGALSLPAVFITGGLAFSLSVFVMFPTATASFRAMDAVMAGSMKGRDSQAGDKLRAKALVAGMDTWKEFLKNNVESQDVQRFVTASKKIDSRFSKQSGDSNSAKDQKHLEDSWRILIPAFFVSELGKAFEAGFKIILPFFAIDIIIAVVLSALGLTTLDAHVISLPLKVLLFVLLDGWTIIANNLIFSY